MMKKTLRTGAVALAALALVAAGAQTAGAQVPNPDALKCSSTKLKVVSKDWAGQLKCYSKAVGKGLGVDPLCLSKVTTKTSDSFAKAELKGGCPVDGNAFDQNTDTIPDGMLDSIRHQIDLGFNITTSVIYRGLQGPTTSAINRGIVPQLTPLGTTSLSKCASKKLGAASKLAAALYKCESSVAKKNLPSDPTCLNSTLTGKTDKAVAKFNAAFAKEEAVVGNDCQTTGDATDVGGELFQTFTKILPSLPRFDGCGNSYVTPGETCDDGNFAQFDSCPSDCTIDACTATSNPQPVTVHIADGTATAATIELDYPEGKVSLPGTGFDPPSITDLSGSPAFSSIDFDHALRIVAANDSGLGPDIAALAFVDCTVVSPPLAVGDFTCNVRDAADAGGAPLTTTCSVTIP